MGTKKSDFTASTSVADTSTFDFVINGENKKITKANLLVALGVTGTISQVGAVSGTPVLDVSGGADKLIRNLESDDGVSIALSPENGITIGSQLVAGANVSITSDGSGGLTIAASIGSVANTVVVQSKSDLPTPVAGVITLAIAAYTIKGNIDLGTDVIVQAGGSVIFGDTATLSSITSNSASPTITASAGGFAACGIDGLAGILINNTGAGAAIRVTDSTTIWFGRNLLTTAAGNALELNGVGGVSVDGWTITSGVTNGCVMTGTNPRTLMDKFNTIAVTGKGIDIQGPMTGPLILILPIISSVGNCIESNQAITGITITDGSLVSSTGTGFRFSGSTTGQIRVIGSDIVGTAGDAIDFSGASSINTFACEASTLSASGASNACFRTDSPSSNNISSGGDFIATSFITASTAVALVNASKGDPILSFGGCLGNTSAVRDAVANSVTLGCFVLDSATTTTVAFQGDHNGTITGMADAGSGSTTVTTSGTHGIGNGEPVAVFGTTSYNGLFTTASVTATTFDIVRAFVSDDATGSYESGWLKISGSTTDCADIERFTGSGNNELQYIGLPTATVTYTASITGQRATGSSPELFEFALFCDDQSGSGFVKVNGSVPADMINRKLNVSLRIPTSAGPLEQFTAHVRNTEGTTDIDIDGLTVDVSAI